jgi:hypothetical protein
MVLEELNLTAGDLVRGVIGVLLERFTWLMTFIKAVGILVIIYSIYLIIKVFRDMKMRSRVKRIEGKVSLIDKKLDILLKQKSTKQVFPEEEKSPEKKSLGFLRNLFKKKDTKKKKKSKK